MNKLSPMMEQYIAIKEEHPDKILFFQVGDFYELFYEDARVASKELDLVLTTRDGDKENAVPLAGIPIHAIDGYLARMLDKGYKVVICNQAEDASQAKGLVKREIARIVTPGTVIEESMLKDTQNNYLLSVLKDGDSYYSVAFTDVSTGIFRATEITGEGAAENLRAELQRINPTEIICTSWMKEDAILSECLQKMPLTTIEEVPESYFFYEESLDAINNQWAAEKIKKEDITSYPLAVAACGALIKYLKSLQKTALIHLKPVEIYFPGEYLIMDGITRRNLELTQTIREGKRKGSLLSIIDKTSSSMGGRLLKRWIEQPLKDINKINLRIEAVAEFYDKTTLKNEVRVLLGKIFDLERLCSRINYNSINARDLIALKNTLNLIPEIITTLDKAGSLLLKDICIQLPSFEILTVLIEKAIMENPPLTIREGNIIKDGYNADVDRLRKISKEGKQFLLEYETEEKEKTGIKSLKVGYNRIYGYYLEVTKNNLPLVPEHYHRKQTLVNAERFITEKLKTLEDEITGAQEKLNQIEYSLFEELRQEVLKHTMNIQLAAELLAETDCLQGLAESAVNNRYCRPELSADNPLSVKQGRHPVIEKMNLGERFVPNDVYLDANEKILLITGPNMAGKSTYCRSVALISLMAQTGSFVPAGTAVLPVLDRIYARVGASDDLSAGQSTFMVEMNETASILKEATPNTLIILDETGRGTSTYDGMSIARSVLEYICRKLDSWTLFSTHYHELTVLEDEFSSIKNYTMAVRERGNSVIFLRKVVPGKADKSYGINVARIAGLPTEVIDRAETILSEIETQNRKNPDSSHQISFFEINESDNEENSKTKEAVKYIKDMKPDLMSPLEALQELFKVQALLKEIKED